MKRLIHLSEWKMHYNCCSLSSLNYVLLALAQVNNTSSVYCSAQPCQWNQGLTKERGNLQFAGSGSQEVANSNCVSQKGNLGEFCLALCKADKSRVCLIWNCPFGKVLCVWERERWLFVVGSSKMQCSNVEKSKAQGELQALRHQLWDMAALELFSLASLFPRAGDPCSVMYEVPPRMVRRLFLFWFNFLP